MVRFLPLVAALLAFSACHPLGCYYPKELPKDEPLSLTSAHESWPKSEVEVMVGNLGVPHIFGASEPDIAYGLGFMHGRDRTWQMLFTKHAAHGRLSELLGDGFLSADQFLRLASFPKDRVLSSLSPRVNDILEAYAAGINESAKARGRTAEMDVLGVDFGTWEPIDSVAIALFFVNDQSAAFRPELARKRLINRLGTDDPVAQILLSGAPALGNPIVTDDEHSGDPAPQTAQTAQTARTSGAVASPLVHHRKKPVELHSKSPFPDLDERVRNWTKGLWEPQGHSNSWSLAPENTREGVAVLANDPHLGHQAPGIFYFAHLELAGDDGFSITGGSFPGVPAILIGYGRDIAWGITNAYGDCQDIVEIEPGPTDDEYILNGRAQSFGSILQVYKLGKEDDAPTFEESWRTTEFGPIIPPGHEFLVDEGDLLAYQWCADKFADEMDGTFSMWWDLGRAANIAEADAALARFVTPPMSFNMAFTDGTIAYRTAGYYPERLSETPIHLPRDGKTSQGGLGAPIPYAQKPQLTNPAKGYIVASNQRIVDDDSAFSAVTGKEGANGFRAFRIDERVARLVEPELKPTANDVLAVQQDIQSVEARDIAQILGANCGGSIEDHPEDRVRDFCSAVANFDGDFTAESLSALPYQLLMSNLVREIMFAHLGEEAGADMAGRAGTRGRVYEEVKREGVDGYASPLFDHASDDGREGLAFYVTRALKPALDEIVKYGGGSQDWRWDKAHTLTFRNPLASAPLIGGLFKSPDHKESGCKQCVRAEGPIPVSTGAGLRMIAEMSTPPRVRMVGDLGQVGHFGHKNAENMYPLWTKGEPVEIPTSRERIEAERQGWVQISPR